MSAPWLGVALATVALVGCSGRKATEIVVDVATDLVVPADINRINLKVHYLPQGIVTGKLEDLVADQQIDVNWDLERSIAGVAPVQLPATIGLLAGKDVSQRVLITVLGMKEQKEVVRRQALLTFAPERIVVVHLNLLKRCSSPVSCSERETCGENGCQDLELDTDRLPDFSPAEVARHFLDGRVVDQRRDRPGTDARDGPRIDARSDGPRSDAKVDLKKTDAPKVDIKKVDIKKVDAAPGLDLKPGEAKPQCSGWTSLNAGTTANLNGVWGSSGTDVWVVGGPSVMKCTLLHYNGTVWAQVATVQSNCQAALNAVSGATGSDVHVVGDYRTGMPSGIEAWHFDGTSWQSKVASNMGMFQGVWVAPSGGDAFAARTYYVGSASISRYTTATGSWNMDTTAPGSSFAAVWGTSSSDVFIAGNVNGSNNADVQRASSPGWLSIPPATNKTLRAIWGLSGEVFVVGDDGTIWRNHTITTWYDESVAGGSTLRGVSGRGGANQRIFAVGENASIYERVGTSWQQRCSTPAGPALKAIWCDPAGVCCYAVGAGGLVLQRCGV